MKEAQITCICRTHRIPDLGLSLESGDSIWLDEKKFHQSKDAKYAQKIGAIDVRWRERCCVSKQPPPPSYRRNKTPRKAIIEQVERLQTTIVREEINLDRIEKQVKAAVVGEVSKHLEGLKDLLAQQVAQSMPAPQVREEKKELDADQLMASLTSVIENAVASRIAEALASQPKEAIDTAALASSLESTMRSLVASIPQVQQAAQQTAKSEEPLYIPTGIVEEKAKGKVDVQVGASEKSGLDDASAALKALKKKKKQTDGDGS